MGVVASHYERWLARACIGVAVTADNKRPFSGPTYLLWEVSTSGEKRPFSGPLYLLWEVPTVSYCCSLMLEMCHIFKASVIYLYVMSLPGFWWRHSNIYAYWDFSAFTSIPTSLIKFIFFYGIYGIDLYHQRRRAADVSHIISARLIFLDHPNVIFWSKAKTGVMKNLLVLENFG
jgi:hypothetical protein